MSKKHDLSHHESQYAPGMRVLGKVDSETQVEMGPIIQCLTLSDQGLRQERHTLVISFPETRHIDSKTGARRESGCRVVVVACCDGGECVRWFRGISEAIDNAKRVHGYTRDSLTTILHHENGGGGKGGAGGCGGGGGGGGGGGLVCETVAHSDQRLTPLNIASELKHQLVRAIKPPPEGGQCGGGGVLRSVSARDVTATVETVETVEGLLLRPGKVKFSKEDVDLRSLFLSFSHLHSGFDLSSSGGQVRRRIFCFFCEGLFFLFLSSGGQGRKVKHFFIIIIIVIIKEKFL